MPFEVDALILISLNLEEETELRGIKFLLKVIQFISDGFEPRQLELWVLPLTLASEPGDPWKG